MKTWDALKPFTANLILIWLAILLYRLNRYYASFLKPETQSVLLWLAIIYTIGGLLLAIYRHRRGIIPTASKGLLIIQSARRFFFTTKETDTQSSFKITDEEKTALLFTLVKFFFLPIMVNFFFQNIDNFYSAYQSMVSAGFSFDVISFNKYWYPLFFAIILIIDTVYFIFGYSVELKGLGNTVRSVEPTAFGWAVALLCYPPFNGILNKYVSWYANDYVFFWTDNITFIMYLVCLALFFIYVWATIALGAKCSNLTNRGTVSRGPYAFVRHPAYISKNLAWWLTILPVMSFGAFFSMSVWSLIYFARALTEERHLLSDPNYQKYSQRVPHRFIPGVW